MLSIRLKAVADMVTKNKIVADIGTDHGYVPIYLVKNNIVKKAYAMDINEGPLLKASQNIKMNHLSKSITTILSNGMDKLESNMANSIVIAGMGGDLIVDILKRGENIEGIDELILSPHKRVDLVRKYLISNGYKIVDETMVIDAKKFYTIIKACVGQEEEYSEEEYMYGRILLNRKDETLKKYLEKENKKFAEILKAVKQNDSNDVSNIEEILKINNNALNIVK